VPEEDLSPSKEMELKRGKYEDKSEHETRNQNPNKHRRQMKKKNVKTARQRRQHTGPF